VKSSVDVRPSTAAPMEEEAVPADAGPEWDAVSQASWDSFPASDPPGWINTSRCGRPGGASEGT